MDKEIISNNQGTSLMILFIMGSLIMIGADGEAGQDIWLVIITALLMSIPIIFIYSKLISLYPGKDLYDILKEVFGNILGKIISSLFVWYSFHLGSLVTKNFSSFVNVVSFPETPETVIVIFIGLFCIWGVKAGIEVLGRMAKFILPISLTIIGTAIILSMTEANINNLRPILYRGFKPLLSSSFGLFTFPLAETVVFTMAFSSLRDTKKTFKVYFTSICIASLVMMSVAVRNICVLGVPLTSSLTFPSYIAVRTIQIGQFLQRFEIVVAIIFIFGGFIKISVCLYASTLGLAKILNIDNYRNIVSPVGFLMMAMACIIYKSVMEMFEWAVKIYPFYVIPFQIILPIITLIAAKIKLGKQKKKNPITRKG